MMDWDKVRKNRVIAKRGTSADNEIVTTFALMWRRPFKAPASKTELREQATEAHREWQLRHPKGFRPGRPASAGSLITSAATATSSSVSW
jgi:hypothetical protein